MKKTYISPNFLLVELRCKVNMLEGSIQADGNRTITTAADGNWVKGNSSTVSDVNVWDDEW
jgi:hypothetical protein